MAPLVSPTVAVVLVACTALLFGQATAQDVVGCGGFAKASKAISKLSKSKADFSSIKVNLLMKDGPLKYATECAPNGYYFVPIYDKGDFVLKIEGPEGWKFDTEEVPVTVSESGVAGCEQDVNFYFTGFQVSGTVTAGKQCGSLGAYGVSIALKDAEGSTVGTTVSDESGAYSFSGVMPGAYTVTASHSSWLLSTTTADVQVGMGNAQVGTPLAVSGYPVTGSVRTANGADAVAGVSALLYADDDATAAALAGAALPCAGALPSQLPEGRSDSPVCVAASAADGSFALQGVPCGKYSLLPFFRGPTTAFDVAPKQMAVEVSGGAVSLSPPLRVMGFSLAGRVVDGSGSGVAGATVTLSGRSDTVVTAADGSYLLERLATGTYDITASLPGTRFTSLSSLALKPSASALPDMAVSGYQLCGQVRAGDKGGVKVAGRRVVLQPSSEREEAGEASRSTSASGSGDFCFWVSPGDYSLSAPVTAAERQQGVLLAPESLTVTVTAPVKDIVFSPVRSSVAGAVACLGSSGCGSDLTISLARAAGGAAVATTVAAADGSFSFPDVVPGSYIVSATHAQDAWCWGAVADGDAATGAAITGSAQVVVGFEAVTDVAIKQSGYAVAVSATHGDISLQVRRTPKKKGKKGKLVATVAVGRGTTRFCLTRARTYALRPSGCYKFSQTDYSVAVGGADAAAAPVELTITHFRITGTIAVSKGRPGSGPVPTVSVSIASDGAATVVKAKASAAASASALPSYTFTHWAGVGDSITVTPQETDASGAPSTAADRLLFSPASRAVEVSARACPPPLPPFDGRAGTVLRGEVRPALAGVAIAVTAADEEGAAVGDAIATVLTDAKGQYEAGPLPDGGSYTVSASKLGFHFQSRPQAEGSSGGDGALDFVHKKLGKLEVSITTADAAQPVAGALLSVIGDGYRNNSATGAGGALTFYSLFPGSYFLRAQLKEYTFAPRSHSVEVEEGSSASLTFTATRVAFSAYGSVRSLASVPQSGVAVAARCAADGHHEETVTDSEGNFRIRGLRPGSTYSVTVRTDGSATAVARASPAQASVSMEARDVTGLAFTAFAAQTEFSVSGTVQAEKAEWMDSLSVQLTTASDTGKVLRKVTPGLSRFFEFTGLPKGAYVLRAVTSLSSRDYTFTTTPALFTLGGADAPVNVIMRGGGSAPVALPPSARPHATLKFHADARPLAADANSGSLWLLLLAAAACLAVVYQQDLAKAAASLQAPSGPVANQQAEYLATTGVAAPGARKKGGNSRRRR